MWTATVIRILIGKAIVWAFYIELTYLQLVITEKQVEFMESGIHPVQGTGNGESLGEMGHGFSPSAYSSPWL